MVAYLVVFGVGLVGGVALGIWQGPQIMALIKKLGIGT